MTHGAYWASIGFQDPCNKLDVEEFNKCLSCFLLCGDALNNEVKRVMRDVTVALSEAISSGRLKEVWVSQQRRTGVSMRSSSRSLSLRTVLRWVIFNGAWMV